MGCQQNFSFGMTEKIETWSVPMTANYRIVATGAKAGDGQHRTGGRGAVVEATFRYWW